MKDLMIDRQKAIKLVADYLYNLMSPRCIGLTPDYCWKEAEGILAKAPSAEPDASDCWGCNCQKIERALGQSEIIRCKDCKYRDENWRKVSVRWLPCMDVRTGSNWYCGSAERGEQDE